MKKQEYRNIKWYLELLREQRLITEYHIKEDDYDKIVRYLSYDSQDVQGDTLFVCKGAHFKGKYLADAVSRGAFCYVAEKLYGEVNASYIITDDIRKTMVLLANAFYCEPWNELKLAGITATKGKSTTAYFVRSVLDVYLTRQGKPKSGILSSIENYDGVIFEESHLTTPEALMLQRHFRNALNSGIEYMTMEVSSQALKYGRVDGMSFDVGCFINIGEDHISDIEHADFDDYFESKLKLFPKCHTACVNVESDHVDEILKSAENCERIITFGKVESAEIYGYRVVKHKDYTSFMVRTPLFEKEFHLAIPGLFNVDNALAAIAICSALAIPEDDIYAGLAKAKVSGRMEVFYNEEKNITVIVDYAHNRMSFDRLFSSTLHEYPGCNIYAIYGCPGGKAQTRRKELSEIAARYSKKVYVTEEDAGEEDVMKICAEIADNLKEENCDFAIIPDREEAIRTAILEAERDAVILLTGKGRETRQKRGTLYVDCPSDVEYVEKYLYSI